MHPILFSIGNFSIYSYGVMMALAFIAGILLARRRAPKDEIDPDTILDIGLYILIAGIVGARLLHVLVNLSYYVRSPLEILMLHHGGLIFYGGAIAALLTSYLFLKRRRISILLMGDCIVPYLALGQAIGRVGCFLNGCCFGRPTTLPWGILFPASSLNLHPAPIYLSLNGILIFLILDFIRERKGFTGQVFLCYFILYSFTRFLIEFMRGDTPAVIFGVLTLSQVLSVVIFALSIIVYKKLSKNG